MTVLPKCLSLESPEAPLGACPRVSDGAKRPPERGVDMSSADGTHKGSIVAGHWNRGLDACGSKLQPDLMR